jgi:hypothetical protein
MCGLDNTSASCGLGSYSSSSPLNYSFANRPSAWGTYKDESGRFAVSDTPNLVPIFTLDKPSSNN